SKIESPSRTTWLTTWTPGCFVEILLRGGKEHQVMGEHPQEDFLLLTGPLAGSQGRAEQALLPGEAALDLPPLPIHPPLPPPHPPPRCAPGAARPPAPLLRWGGVCGLGRAPPAVAAVEREHLRANAQLLPAVGVVVLGVVGHVPKQRVQRAAGGRRPRRRLEL